MFAYIFTDLGMGTLGPDAPSLKIYHEQVRKLKEAVVQVHLHFTHIYKGQGEKHILSKNY